MKRAWRMRLAVLALVILTLNTSNLWAATPGITLIGKGTVNGAARDKSSLRRPTARRGARGVVPLASTREPNVIYLACGSADRLASRLQLCGEVEDANLCTTAEPISKIGFLQPCPV
jgi:hypothetical protein